MKCNSLGKSKPPSCPERAIPFQSLLVVREREEGRDSFDTERQMALAVERLGAGIAFASLWRAFVVGEMGVSCQRLRSHL